MNFLRSRTAAILFFTFLTLGQAYPFSVAWGMKGSGRHICCCHETAEVCRCRHGKSGAMGCHHEKKTPGYASLPCGSGGKSQAETLSFQGDPCMPSRTKPISLSLFTQSPADYKFDLPLILLVPEAPPPKA